MAQRVDVYGAETGWVCKRKFEKDFDRRLLVRFLNPVPPLGESWRERNDARRRLAAIAFCFRLWLWRWRFVLDR
jgi:hypothetical protein